MRTTAIPGSVDAVPKALALTPLVSLNVPIMPKKFRKSRFAMKEDRQLIALVQTNHSAQAIAERMRRPITAILKRAQRLDISIKGKAAQK